MTRNLAANRIVKARFQASHDRDFERRPGVTAPVFLPSDWSMSPRLQDKANGVSSHLYSPSMIGFLSGFGPDRFILAAGAGLRKRPGRNVINLEIFDDPSTDIISTRQTLRFKANSFDGVISMAVLASAVLAQADRMNGHVIGLAVALGQNER